MKNTAKKTLAMLLCLVMALSLLPGMTAWAEGEHTHSFEYSASGDTITATCQNEGCTLTDNKVTLKIVATTNLYANDGLSKEASLEGLEEYNEATGFNLSTSNILYRKGTETFSTTRIKNGTAGVSNAYEARIAYNGTDNFGNKVAKVSFALTQKPDPHTHSFSYTVSEDGKSIIATCTQSSANMEACDLTNNQATLTLNAPLHTMYDDGKDANATFTGNIPGVTNPTINYRRSDTPLGTTAPTDAGEDYVAWCQLGNATASVTYSIAKRPNPGWTTLPQAKTDLVYSSAAQELVTAGATSTGEIRYGLGTVDSDANAYYTGAVPSAVEAGTYYVWCKIEGGRNYTSTTAQKLTVTIAKADPSYTTPTGLTATYGDTLADVTLPEGWTWADSTTSVGNAGTNSFPATFTPSDTNNYNVVENVSVSVTVAKADPTYTTPTGLSATYGDTLADVTLPEGWTWADSTTSVGNAGTNSFPATFTPSDTNNYNVVENVSVSVTVAKADPTYTTPTGLSATYGDTLADVTLPDGWTWADDTQSVGNAGNNSFKATFTPGDTDNYNVVENIDVVVAVAKAAITPTVSMEGWNYGEKANTPAVSGNTGNGNVSYTYAVKGSDSFSEAVPNVPGTYTVKAVIAESDNYLGGEATADFVIGNPVYTIASVNGVANDAAHTWYKGSGKDAVLTVKLSGDNDVSFEHFTGVSIDGAALSTSDYSAVKGSTVVTLKAATLEKLKTGPHGVTIHFDNGRVDYTLTVKPAQSAGGVFAPKTGDETNLALWLAILAISGAGLAAVIIVKKRRA